MTYEQDCVAIVPARAGSERFPSKNRARIAGLTLLERTCRTIEASGICRKILLSTDDPELLEAASAIPGLEPIERPAYLATSSAKTIDVLRHLIKTANLEKNWLVLTQLTSPLRLASDIQATVEKARHSSSLSAVSVTRWRIPASGPHGSISNPAQLGQSLDNDWKRATINDGKCWAVNGAVYAFMAKKIIEEDRIYDEASAIHVMPSWRSIDIDYAEDLDLAERLAASLETEL